jgi:TRAP-type C4-dicarboxylate transport system permease small subunit
MKGIARFNTIFDRVIDIMFYAASGLSLVIFCSVCTELFMRNLFNRPQIWSVEVTEYAMLYLTFLGTAWLLREEGHVRLDILFVLLKPPSQILLNSVTSIFGAIVCSVLTFYGTWSTWLHYQKGLHTFSAMELLKWPFLIVIPFGSLLLLIQFVRSAFAYWEEFKSYKKAE